MSAADTVARLRREHATEIRQVRLAAHLFGRSAASLLGLGLVLLFLVLAAFGPEIVPYPGDALGAIDMGARLQPPSIAHLFGTDEMGNDIFTRVVIGTRTSLAIGLAITGIAAAIGVPLGVVAGTAGPVLRAVILRTTDVFLSVPALVLAFAIVAALGPGIGNTILALSLVWWPGYVRLTEAKALQINQELFVEAARAVGARRGRILFRHVLPNCLSPLIVKASMDMGMAILSAASLGFVGLGAKPPAPEWGSMISVARTYMPTWWWYALFPGLAIYLTVLGFNLFGDGLRDVLDPQSNRG